MIKKSIRKANIKKVSIRKYDDGFYVDDAQALSENTTGTPSKFGQFINSKQGASAINTVGQYGATAVNAFQPVNGDSSAGLGAASGALTGAGTGAALGSVIPGVGTLIGGAVGAVVGGTAGLISGGAKHRKYEQQLRAATSDNYFNTRANMIQNNPNLYGNYEFGDFIGLDDPFAKKKAKQVAQKQPTYDKSLLLGDNQHFMTSARGSDSKPVLKYWGNDIVPDNTQIPIAPQVISDKALGYSNTFYPARGQQQSKTPDTLPHSSYANGASIGLSGRAAGKFFVPNAGLRHFVPHMSHNGKINPIPSNNIDFSQQTQNSPQTMGDGDNVMPTNSQQNIINIQKGELLINPQDGKILQEYNGVNPLTGGMYEPHAKKGEDTPNNFTLADPGLFIITKKTAKQYKDAMDNNDKISQKTVLMNIRNAKIQKEGGLQPQNYAYGDTVNRDKFPLPNINLDAQPDLTGLNIPDSQVTSKYPGMYDGVASMPTNIAANQSKTDRFGDALDTFSKYAPAIYNTAQGLFGKVQHQPYATPIANPYASQVIANMPKDVNMSPVISDIYANQNATDKSLLNNTNNSAVYRANRQNVANGTNRALIDARMKAAEVNNQAAGQRSYMYNALGYQDQQAKQQERQYNFGVDEVNARREGAKQNMLNTGISQLQQVNMNDKMNSQKQGMDKYSLDLLKQIFPNLKYYDEFDKDKIFKALGR